MKPFAVLLILGSLMLRPAFGQIIAGSPEDKLFTQITAEANPDAKLQLLLKFEQQFPDSKGLPDIYTMLIDVYRQKNDRAKLIEYGEKTLKVDSNNITAMMVLARNYALEHKNLDRAVDLGRQSVDLINKMKTQPPPPQFTDAQWKSYLENTESAARSIWEYAKSIKGK